MELTGAETPERSENPWLNHKTQSSLKDRNYGKGRTRPVRTEEDKYPCLRTRDEGLKRIHLPREEKE